MPDPVIMKDAKGGLLRLDVLRRTYAETTDDFEGNWLRAVIEISTPTGQHEYEADLRSEEFARFLSGLRNIEHDLTGSAALVSLEDWIDVLNRGDGTGNFSA